MLMMPQCELVGDVVVRGNSRGSWNGSGGGMGDMDREDILTAAIVLVGLVLKLAIVALMLAALVWGTRALWRRLRRAVAA